MKKMVIVILLALIQFSVVNAQGRMSAKERAKDLKDKLELTDEQSKKVEIILEDNAAKMKELRANNTGDRAAMFKAMQPLNEASDKRIDSVLNDKQKEAYAKIKEERQNRMKERARPQN